MGSKVIPKNEIETLLRQIQKETTMIKSQARRHCAAMSMLCPQPPFIQILQGAGDGNGGHVCFICDKTMDKGEPFICLDRLLEVDEAGDAGPRVVDAGASLQVCLPCTLLSGYQRLEWATKPKLTGVEVWGFRTYARLLAESVSRNRWDTCVQQEVLKRFARSTSYHLAIKLDRIALLGGTRQGIPLNMIGKGHCLKCHGTIDFANSHLAFEIGIDTPWRNGMQRSNIWHLGEYCYKCSSQLLPLYQRLWR